MTDFSRISASWLEWSHRARMLNPNVSLECDDCEIAFTSGDFSIHLRHDADWWTVDTIDDRGQRRNDTAKLSSLELAEKYLMWIWSSLARGVIGAPPLGPQLYSAGFSPDVTVTPIKAGIAELLSPSGKAILMEPYATIFSHLMSKSVDEIGRMIRAGIA
ncbi:hypothetical protein [Mycobacterium seoulense]|uniref:Uncharacterized protein n=1 Tax=Mycobacterium seoulense TaxID=386911 RepID=A0A7I7P3Q0_9MYCO|nr:hypothetical protein [Mycobacterium seoulense]MCV7438435.1 hypothetical protein [Mycobacterium seoulense]BBY03486.1 hypothetical protein MSEO_39850 [Mycobacterium seoulense]